MSDHSPWDHRPPLAPPPPDVIALYRAYLAAAEALRNAQAALPEPYHYLIGGQKWPREQLAEARRLADARARAAVALYDHPWWRGAFDRDEAQAALNAAILEEREEGCGKP